MCEYPDSHEPVKVHASLYWVKMCVHDMTYSEKVV